MCSDIKAKPQKHTLIHVHFAFAHLQSDNYGFKCLVVGYEGFSSKDDGLRSLEMELSYLGGICAASLMRKVIPLSNPNGYCEAGPSNSEVRTLKLLKNNYVLQPIDRMGSVLKNKRQRKGFMFAER